MSRVRNDLFNSRKGLNRGRAAWIEAIWYVTKCVFFLSAIPWPCRFKCWVLRLFGARIGRNVYLKPRINIHFPWKLSIGEHSWIGEEVSILNLEPVAIGNHCCISQRAFLCTGNHDYETIEMAYRNASIILKDGVWVGAQVFVGPGVKISEDCVVAACSMVNQSLPAGMVCSGNPCRTVKARWKS
jgi:putative colanic acid biosynthesis acetyltransferase WcaF